MYRLTVNDNDYLALSELSRGQSTGSDAVQLLRRAMLTARYEPDAPGAVAYQLGRDARLHALQDWADPGDAYLGEDDAAAAGLA